jgi:hypothetical protein
MYLGSKEKREMGFSPDEVSNLPVNVFSGRLKVQ